MRFTFPIYCVDFACDARDVKEIMHTFLTSLDITLQDKFMEELGQEQCVNLPEWIRDQSRYQSYRTSEDEEPSPRPILTRKRRTKRRPRGSRRQKRTEDDLFEFVREEPREKRWFSRVFLLLFCFSTFVSDQINRISL